MQMVMRIPNNFRNLGNIKFSNMKKILFAALPIATIAMFCLNTPDSPLQIGASIPKAEVKMQDIGGTEISFNDAMKENGLMVMFSCNTCPVVHKYESRTIEVCKKALSKNIGVILLNSNEAYRGEGDSYVDMKSYAEKLGYTFNYALDKNSVMADAFGANRTPEIFLFNNEKKLVYHGAIDDNSSGPDQVTRKHASIAMDEMTEGKDVSMKETKSVGCTIKRM